MGSNPTLSAIFYTYILKSLKDNTYYNGSTADLDKRLSEHNSNKEKYTKGHTPYKLHYYEKYAAKSEAMKREKYFKSIDGYIWLKQQKII